MISIIRQKIQERAEEVLGHNPPSNVGWWEKTSTILETELKTNPYFLPLNNMSLEEGEAAMSRQLELDSIKVGMSVVAKTPSAEKGERVYINPKHVNGILGGDTGKTYNLATSQVEISFTGSHNQAPTVMAVSNVTIPPPTTLASNKDIEENSIAKGQKEKPADPLNSDNKIEPTLEDFSITKKDLENILHPFNFDVPDIDPITGKESRSKENGRSNNRSNIRTGTTLLDDITLANLTQPHNVSNFNFSNTILDTII